jgi:NADH-quinone oxidoreductase subunit E
MVSMENFMLENKDAINEVKNYIVELGYDKNSLIMILHKAQNILGYLPREILEIISDELKIPLAKVYGVVTFYSYFTTEKKGTNRISVCLGTACFVKGAEAVLEEFKKQLSIEMGETTEDGLFTLDNIRCIGACGLAPVVSINDKIYGNVKKEDVKSILDEYRKTGE